MRILLLGMLITFLIVGNVLGGTNAQRYVVPINNDIGVFAHNPKTSGEKPIFIAGSNQWLMVLDAWNDQFKVTDMKGNTGWIDKAAVKPSKTAEPLKFSGASVSSYLDNPTPIIILDADNPSGNSIMLERSFAREIEENIDLMTIARIVGQ